MKWVCPEIFLFFAIFFKKVAISSSKASYARNPKREKTSGTKNSEELHWMPIIRPVKKFSCFF
jgi:hypothetical protein